MARLVVYVRSRVCPDVARWRRWLQQHELDYVELDIDSDAEAYDRVLRWTGFESVPTLVIAPDDGLEPIEAPSALPPGRGPRAIDRGTMLTEPNPGQIVPFLERNGIPVTRLEGSRDGGIIGRLLG
ncbi:MAG: glutaredoxin family protein [Dehalococcoidia bacterium]